MTFHRKCQKIFISVDQWKEKFFDFIFEMEDFSSRFRSLSSKSFIHSSHHSDQVWEKLDCPKQFWAIYRTLSSEDESG